ncbi:MAG: lipase maturation factor family protein [Myxococcales bacterium]|nr:lipase maturation factor family protein [Myxococcales bacterium]
MGVDSQAPGQWSGGAVVVGRDHYRVTRRIFLAGLGLTYFAAFVSLGAQITGLVGANGILPATEFLAFVRERFGNSATSALPSLAWWFGAGDGALRGFCVAGAAAALMMMLGLVPTFAALACWGLYLTVFGLGQRFLSFQWDILLLEVGFLAMFLAPPFALRLGKVRSEPSRAVVWFLRFVLFKLMFSSGVVKLAAGDPSWRDLTALTYHYETTCLPTWTGWWMHRLPVWFHQASAGVMYLIELGAPFLIFGGRRARMVAAGAFASLMIFIGATGNYGFFNLLSVVLCVPLLDDAAWPGALRRRLLVGSEGEVPLWTPAGLGRNWGVWFLVPILVVVALLQVPPFARAFRLDVHLPGPLAALERALDPWHLVGGYGLFASMTKTRPEILVEGSRDGREWKAYGFRYKPGDPMRRPGFVFLHMPRLDWRMWFAALRPWPPEWFVRFAERLAEGSPEVLDLLNANPFPDDPPRYVRARLVDYRFTTAAERRETGAWWRLGDSEEYLAPITSRRGRGVDQAP